MTIISTREFRANQGKYLKMVAKGQDVVLKSRTYGSFKLSPVTEDDTLMSKEDFFAMINHSVSRHKQNPSGAITLGENETGEELLKRIIAECTE